MKTKKTEGWGRALLALALALSFGVFAMSLATAAEALPLYAARSARTCDNCHSLPNTWKNPEVEWRKCNMSCITCHVDPSGGGMRNVSGRYYGESTLPMMLAGYRGYEDRERWPLGDDLDGKRVHRSPELAWGSPLGEPSRMAFLDKRYFGLNADPLLQVGLDARLATWVTSGSATVFPMQLDTHAALHPVPYVTAFATAGVLAKARGFEATLERETVYALKDASVMVHQLPGMAYVRAGRFVPSFGTRLEDHTSYVRRDFELDPSTQHSRVIGAEVGLSPNYPFAHVSVFRPNQSDLLDGDDPFNDRDPPWLGVDGWGLAAHAGWRDLLYGFGASYMMKRRDLLDGGDTESASLQAQLNLWALSEALPFTFLAETAVGRRQRQLSGASAWHVASFVEADWLATNGLNVRLKYDFNDPDAAVGADHVNRLGAGFDLHPIPNVTLTGQARFGIPAARELEDPMADFIIFLRTWL